LAIENPIHGGIAARQRSTIDNSAAATSRIQPFGFALFYLRGVAGNRLTTLEIYRGVVPFTDLTAHFVRTVGDAALVSTQNPLRLSQDTEPRPDLMLLVPRADRYRLALPSAADVLLLVEVADTTLAFDRDVKVPLYARQRVREVWVVDLAGERIHVFRDPDGGAYRVRRELVGADRASPEALPGVGVVPGSLFR
jgi:hypothetical protein